MKSKVALLFNQEEQGYPPCSSWLKKKGSVQEGISLILVSGVVGKSTEIRQGEESLSQPKDGLNSFFCPPGETGIGKSTLMDTLFNTNFENFESSHFEPEVKLRAQTYDLNESNVRLRLTVVNTVGFGDQMNKQERWEEFAVWLKTTCRLSEVATLSQ